MDILTIFLFICVFSVAITAKGNPTPTLLLTKVSQAQRPSGRGKFGVRG